MKKKKQWWSLIFIIVAIAWIWFNPRIFSVAKYTDNWTSRGVFGERVWLNRKNVPVPEHHRIMHNILNIVQGIGVIFFNLGFLVFRFLVNIKGFIPVDAKSR